MQAPQRVQSEAPTRKSGRASQSAWVAVIHGAHFDLGSFQGAKASFNDHQSLITTGGILKTDCIVVGFQYPLAVIFLSFSDLILIDVDLAAFAYR